MSRKFNLQHKIQNLPAWKAWHLSGSYQKQIVIPRFARGNKNSLRKAIVMRYKRLIIRSTAKEIQRHTYILTFNQPFISKEMKIGYCSEKACKYLKYKHHRRSGRGRWTCGSWGQKTQTKWKKNVLMNLRLQRESSCIFKNLRYIQKRIRNNGSKI